MFYKISQIEFHLWGELSNILSIFIKKHFFFFFLKVLMGFSYKWNNTEVSWKEVEQGLALVRTPWWSIHGSLFLSQMSQCDLCRDFSHRICQYREKSGVHKKRVRPVSFQYQTAHLCSPSGNTETGYKTPLCALDGSGWWALHTSPLGLLHVNKLSSWCLVNGCPQWFNWRK